MVGITLYQKVQDKRRVFSAFTKLEKE